MSLDFTLSIAALDVSDHNLDAPTFKDLEARYPELGFLFSHLHTLQDHFEDSVPSQDFDEIEKEAGIYEERLRDLFDRLDHIETKIDYILNADSDDLDISVELDLVLGDVISAKDWSAIA